MKEKRNSIQMKTNRCLKALFICLLLVGSYTMYAQQSNQKITITGVIKDADSEVLIGASVTEKGTNNGTITDLDGKFTLSVENNAVIVASFIGYVAQEMPVKGKTSLSITLKEENTMLDQVVVVGYGVQKKATITGSVAAVNSDEIVTTKSQNVQNMLSGKMAGLRVVQKTSEPGNFNNNFEIRGMGSPLIIIDGVARDNMERLDGNDIESLSILKDGAAAIYGVRAANGVVLITTKKGKKGSLELNYSGNFGWQIPSGLPKTINAIDFMVLSNERSMHSVDGGTVAYTDAQIEAYRNGTNQSTDWSKEIMRSMAPQMQHNFNATGGNDMTTYYISFGEQYQESFLKSNDKKYERYTLRSNITSKISNNLTVELNISGTSEETNSPYISTRDVIRSYWRMKPTEPVYANNMPGYYFHGSVDGTNPAAMMNADEVGYNLNRNKWFQSTGAITYNVPFVKGLKIKGTYNYDYYLSDNKIYQKEYYQYTYDEASQTYKSNQKNFPTKLIRENFSRQNNLWNIVIDYQRTFGVHDVSAMVLLEEFTRKGDNFSGKRDIAIPFDELFTGEEEAQEANMSPSSLYDDANRSYAGRFNYAYMQKYLAEFSFRMDGSSKFPTNKQFGFFPTFSLGWRASEEKFWKNSFLSPINYFKLRASYGVMGDDSALNYQFVEGYYYPVTGKGIDSSHLPKGSVFGDRFINGMNDKGIANPYITWYTSKMYNIGFDMDVWNGLLGITFDLFQKDRDGLLATRLKTVPGILGTILPQENLQGDLYRGFDLEVSHRSRVNEFRYSAKATLSLSRRKYKYREESKGGNSFENWRNASTDRWSNIWWGKGTTGQFGSWTDIYNSPTQIGVGALPGDYGYEDWNGDGIISTLDTHPITFSGDNPMLSYGLNLTGEYKGWDLNILFQGAGMNYVSYTGQLIEPLWGGGSALEQFMDRWHPADPTANPYDPNTQWISGHYAYTGGTPDTSSKYNMQNGIYLRLKNVELGYTLPAKYTNKVGIKNVRIYTNAYNILTFTGVKNLDPEHPATDDGYMYPMNKTFSFGLNVKF